MYTAANTGEDHCLELFLADERVDVCRASNNGQTPLISACMQLMDSMDRVGATDGKDPARCCVLMLKSRRIPIQNLTHSIAYLRRAMPTRRDVTRAEAGITPLDNEQKTARLIMPVLEAELKGEHRWCAWCLKLTPDRDLDKCGGCKQVAYCRPLNKLQLERMPTKEIERREKEIADCQRLHWKKGHKQECTRFQEEEEKRKEAEAEAAAASGGGGSGGGKKKKGKGKKGRRR